MKILKEELKQFKEDLQKFESISTIYENTNENYMLFFPIETDNMNEIDNQFIVITDSEHQNYGFANKLQPGIIFKKREASSYEDHNINYNIVVKKESSHEKYNNVGIAYAVVDNGHKFSLKTLLNLSNELNGTNIYEKYLYMLEKDVILIKKDLLLYTDLILN